MHRLIGLLILAAVVAWVLWWRPLLQPPPPVVGPAAAPSPAPPAAEPPARPPPSASAGAMAPTNGRDLATLQRWLAEGSSLRGAELDGDWGLDAPGRVEPRRALRRRFDQLLTLQGEASLDELTRLVRGGVQAAAVRQGLDAATAQTRTDEVLAVWQRYLALQGQAYQHTVRPSDPSTWAAALAERQQARRAHLGPAWAAAFYAEEEAALTAALREAEQAATATGTSMAARSAGTVPATATPGANPARATAPGGWPADGLIDRSQLDAAARARLDAELAAQRDWQRRLDAARAEQQRLAADPQLSDPLRRTALAQWIASHFDAGEQRRVRALLGV